MKTIETDYQKQANDFLQKTNVTMNVKFIKHDKHFSEDKEKRDIYEIKLKRGNRGRYFVFGQSISKSDYFYFTKDKEGKHMVKFLSGNNTFKSIKEAKQNNIGYWNIAHNKGTEPTAYDLLTCLTKYEVGSFEDFCSEFGYNEDSIKANDVYKNVCEEYEKVCAIFNEDELTELQEIQ